MARDRLHIIVPGSPQADQYRPHPRRINIPPVPPPRNPKAHAEDLRRALEAAAKDARARRGGAGITVTGATPGIYVVFESRKEADGLKLESLDAAGSGIALVSVTRLGKTERATVFVPDGKVQYFLKKFEDYVAKRTPKGARRNKDLVERIATIRLATLKALWTDTSAFPAKTDVVWWEVWLRVSDGQEEARLAQFAQSAGVELGGRRLTFPDRIVVLAKGSAQQLSSSIDVLNDLAELRLATDLSHGLHDLKPHEQAEWTKELLERITPPRANAPAVCVLDTGVNRGHPLLQGSLATQDMHACDALWNKDDHHGHGTEMAGLALLGDLAAPLLSNAPVTLRHRLESVKILPPKGKNRPELYGAITADAVARVEIQASARRRGFAMAVGDPNGGDRGQPSSWSAAVDALSAGKSIDPAGGLSYINEGEGPRRLFVLSGGNVDSTDIDHISRSDVEPIHDPGQAWNALTVGACTELIHLDPNDPTLKGHAPLAKAGDLSPYSTTSVPFDRKWPIKPDVVFEGGNKAHDGKHALQVDCLSLLSTYYKPQDKSFVPSWATSASAAQVARLTGILSAEYPSLWPETIRALIVNSARWTPRMQAYVRAENSRKKVEAALLRRFGFGAPELDRARRSASNALTLLVQDRIRPFAQGRLREMKVHELPWPREELLELGEQPVTMRVTLSYFVEPNPARRGWRSRYRYASHGLRFDVMLPTESVPEFKKRLNKMALDEDEEKPDTSSDAADWQLGPQLRHRGSVHSDIWEGTAAKLALRNAVGVFPVTGWWKDLTDQDRSELGVRYGLVVTIETGEVSTDIWTPVAQEIGVPVGITVPTEPG